jgi:hypothetical protein
MDTEIQQLLDAGIASLRIGNKEEARRKLMQVINADEHNEFGWLYLSEAVESDEDRQICLENVLTINPANERAETGLRALEEKLARGQVESSNDVICPTCGVANPPDRQRCISCYADLSQAVSVPPAMGAESSPAGVAVGAPPREVQHKSFMEMLDTWAEIFTLPNQARLDEEHAYARWGLIIPGILLASGITYFFVVLTNVGMTSLMPGDTLDPVLLLPIACGGAIGGAIAGLISFFFNSGIYYLFGRILGGRGEFIVQSYLLSLVYGPVSLVVGILSPLMLLSTVKPALGLIPALITLPISILALIMSVRALKSTHGYGTGAALGTLFLPGIVFCCFGALLSTLVAESLTTTLPFNFSEFQ